ncbi:MAG TPA: aspartate kinase [Flavobacteriales bacterium]
MKVFKFGGASVKDAAAVKNVADILERYSGEKLIVVVSAMGKTTNLLEEVHRLRFHQLDYSDALQRMKDYHITIAAELFGEHAEAMELLIKRLDELEDYLKEPCSNEFDREYDQVVSYGEIVSTTLVEAYLRVRNIASRWLDAREIIITDDCYRNARILWDTCKQKVNDILSEFEKNDVLVLQGFIGKSLRGYTTTLGREGSDFTASIMAFLLDAESVTIWKDVPGMLNADPKWFKDTVKLDKISFKEAIELAYYGASVIHPKTIKPLQNKGIPLYIKSFIHPLEEGSVIQESEEFDGAVPSYIFKGNQVLVSVIPKDFSFVAEDNLKEIFETLSSLGVRINLMENSAISFSFCIDKDEYKQEQLFEKLKNNYTIKYNENLTLITIRHYDDKTIQKLAEGRQILLEQRSRATVRMIVR